jgi:Zn-dependent peptidase ImmA (M78 family)
LPSRNAQIGADHARATREALGLGSREPVPDLLEEVESAGTPVAVLPLADGVAGAWMAGSIFVNGSQHVVRQRFTLAHELGHVRMGHAPVVDHPAALSGSGAGAVPEEVQANAFAAEFLIPEAAVEARVTQPVTLEAVVRLCFDFGVSAQMARIRLETVGLLKEPRLAARIQQEIDEGHAKVVADYHGWEMLTDSLCDLKLPRLPKQPSALAAYLAGRIGLEQLAATTGRPVEEVRTMLARFGISSRR